MVGSFNMAVGFTPLGGTDCYFYNLIIMKLGPKLKTSRGKDIAFGG